MGDITSFPTRHTILETDPDVAVIVTFTAGGTIYAGQVVQLDPTDGDNTVTAGDSSDAAPIVGVALYDAASGSPVVVCCAGTICYVANESGSGAIGEGTTLMIADVDVGGCVVAYSSGAGYIVGVALEDIAANGWGRALIMPYQQVVS